MEKINTVFLSVSICFNSFGKQNFLLPFTVHTHMNSSLRRLAGFPLAAWRVEEFSQGDFGSPLGGSTWRTSSTCYREGE